MAHFFVNTEQLLDYALSLQKINDIALPLAVQNTLNAVARDVKKRTLKQSTEKHFDIKKKTFFSANSGYKPYKAKQFNYNINRLHADVGITKNARPNEKATEQVGSQETATNIKRSINPLGDKPLKSNVINVLSKKPVFYYNNESPDIGQTAFNPYWYIRKVNRAYREGRPFIQTNTGRGRGAVYMINKVTKTSTKTVKGNFYTKVEKTNIASYKKDGHVKLNTKHPFLTEAVEASANDILYSEFVKAANKQVELALKRR